MHCILIGISASGVELRAQALLIDDFGNGSSAWSRVHFPDGQGSFDASTEALQVFMPETAKAVSPTGALFLAALWNGSDSPRFSDGYWRATVQAGNPQSAVGMGLRVSPDNPFVAYPFFAVPELGKAFIMRAEDGVPPVPLAEMDIDMQAGEDWVMEAGAVGEKLFLKLWRAGTVEPPTPQLTVNDSTFESGMFGLAGDVFPEFTADLNATFDGIFFAEQSGFGNEIQVVSPRGVELRDGLGRVPGPTFPVRVQMLYPGGDFAAVPSSHRFITSLVLRTDPTNTFSGAATGPLTVRLSTTPNDSLSTTYDENTGSNEVTVFDGQIEWQSDSSNEFDYTVEFSEPFFYDPADGNLVVDLSTPGLSAASGWWTDNEFPAGPNISFVGGDYQAAVATDAFRSLFPMQFTMASPPTSTIGDCNGDGDLTADDLACVADLAERDAVLGAMNTLPGDLDGNGEVAFADFLVLSGNFGKSGLGYSEGNIDLHDDVSFADFLTLSGNFGNTPEQAVEAVPEPASYGGYLVVMVLLGSIRSRRK